MFFSLLFTLNTCEIFFFTHLTFIWLQSNFFCLVLVNTCVQIGIAIGIWVAHGSKIIIKIVSVIRTIRKRARIVIETGDLIHIRTLVVHVAIGVVHASGVKAGIICGGTVLLKVDVFEELM